MSDKLKFRVQSHVLKLLGDQLIGHDRLAVFELVKNAYDADAKKVTVELSLDSEIPKIVVSDNGSGMSFETIENSWLEIGTNSKRPNGKMARTNLGRMPLGEKGVGRLAIQKLGNVVKIITREENSKEYEFVINWDDLINSSQYIDGGLSVEIMQNIPPKYFKDGAGTIVEITELNRIDWTRKEIRDLFRLISSLKNPFEEEKSFDVELLLPNRENEIRDLPTLSQMLSAAVWVFEFCIDESTGLITWFYEFQPPNFKGLVKRNSGSIEELQLLEVEDDDVSSNDSQEKKKKKNENIFLKIEDLDGIGSIRGKIYAFHRRDEILRASGAPQQIKKWLENQTGVRVYRDNIRVFNYGEPGEDWLGLDARRINRPTGKVGTQSVIAQISLDLESSDLLKEKTNREGFDDNEAFQRLKRIVLSIFDKFQREHTMDRTEIDRSLKGAHEIPPIQDAILKIEKLAKQYKIEKEVKPLLTSIQHELDGFREVMVSSGIAGMNLALIFHEVVHSIDTISRKLGDGTVIEDVRNEINHLRKLLDTFKPLLQRDPSRKVSSEDLVSRAVGMHEDRFERHSVVLSNWTSDSKKSQNFSVMMPRGLMVGAVSNVIDNAIYWSRYRKERDKLQNPAAILVLSAWTEESGNLLIVVDNGPGFQLPEDQFARPFMSTRAGGMGLGLFYCKTVMETIGGKLDIVNADVLRDIIDIPSAYDGAAVIFNFNNK